MDAELKVPARYYARLADVSPELESALEVALKTLRIAPRTLTAPDATIRVSKVDRLIAELSRMLGRTDLGFDLGKQVSASSHSFVGFGMLNSATLGEALRFSMRYLQGPNYGELQLRPRVAMSHLSLSFHLEAIGMAALRGVRDLTGARCPQCQLDISIAEPPHLHRYQKELKGVRVRFEASALPCVSLRILEDPDALRLNMADSHARRVAEHRCRSLVRKAADGGRFADWVAMTLREVADGLPSQEELAGQLNLSTRTLHRYLQREGTSFRELAGRIQHEVQRGGIFVGLPGSLELQSSIQDLRGV